jgi:hypothetical protein
LARLVLGAEPAHDAACLLSDTRVVKGNQAFEHVVGREWPRPTVRLGHALVECIVQVPENAAGGKFVNGAFLVVQRLARTELGNNVVHASHRHTGVAAERSAAKGLELLCGVRYRVAQGRRSGGEREGVEAARVVVALIVTYSEPGARSTSPDDVRLG